MTLTVTFHAGARLRFDGKPSEAIRQALKANGYRWSHSEGVWWRKSANGTAEFVAWLRKQLDREAGIVRPDGACWSCQSLQGFFRRRGAATPVLCDACAAKGGAV